MTATFPIRALLAFAFLAAAALVLLVQEPFVQAEAQAAATLARAGLVGEAASAGPIVWVGIGTADVMAMRITALCSTIVLVTPVLLLGAALLYGLRRAHLHRILGGIAVGLALVLVANQARYLMLGWLGTTFGHRAFLLGHHWIGAIGVLALFALSLFLTVKIAAGGIERPSSRYGVPSKGEV
ncbi:MAG: hypothetical protein Q4G43_02445 [Mobilicoccus sp.]|nr:hypothetical protein [Mobilicoccus sp.]